jgi:hypothetical protein
MRPYDSSLEQIMKALYGSLSEKDRRRYAGIEALKLGQGGRNYIARVLGCSRRTVTKGAQEVSGLPGREVEQRIRQPGGGANRTRPSGLRLIRNSWPFCTITRRAIR